MAKYNVISENEVVFEDENGQSVKLTLSNITEALKAMYIKHITPDVIDAMDSHNDDMCSEDYYKASEDKEYSDYIMDEVLDTIDLSLFDECFDRLDDDLDIDDVMDKCDDFNTFHNIDVEAWEDAHCDPYPPMTDSEFWRYTQG